MSWCCKDWNETLVGRIFEIAKLKDPAVLLLLLLLAEAAAGLAIAAAAGVLMSASISI